MTKNNYFSVENEKTLKYSNNEITIVWKPHVCIHSKICWKQLGSVFKPAERPWITIDGADSKAIMEQVDKCPSGALSYYKNDEAEENKNIKAESIVEIAANGPLLVYGNITVKHPNGEVTQKDKVTAFCRCGQSGNKPYCDGTHTKIDFIG